MASPTQWTWIWVNSGSWWWTGGLACFSLWGREELATTERLNWTKNVCRDMDMNDQPHNEMSWPWIKAQNSEGREWAIFTLVLVQSLSCVWLFVTPWNVAHRLPCPSLSPWVCSNACALSWYCHPTISYSRPLLLLPSVFPSIRVSSSESALHVRWPKYWSISFSISPFIEYSGLISFRIDRFGLLAVQGPLKSLL